MHYVTRRARDHVGYCVLLAPSSSVRLIAGALYSPCATWTITQTGASEPSGSFFPLFLSVVLSRRGPLADSARSTTLHGATFTVCHQLWWIDTGCAACAAPATDPAADRTIARTINTRRIVFSLKTMSGASRLS